MNDVPRAHVENSRIPLHQRPGIRKAVTVAAIVAACVGGWKLLKMATRSEANKKLEARQDKARAQIGHGLDDLFERQLDEDTNRVALVLKLDTDRALGDRYSGTGCAKGLEQAFAEALGPDVVSVSSSTYGDSGLRLELAGNVTATDRRFQLPHSRTEYTGIRLVGDLKLVGKTVHVDVEPPADLEFEYTRYSFDMGGVTDSDVAGGIMQGTCRQAGYVLLEQLTSWKRPEPPPPSDPMKDCERGFHCRESADALAETDPATAAELYAKACQHDDEEACELLAAIVIASPSRAKDALARVTLDLACSQEQARACAAGAQVALISDEPGKPPSDWRRRDALLLALRACDLGVRDACTMAAPLVKGTPYAEAAPLLAGASSVKSKRMGTLFALRWGQWTNMDRGQPTMWATKRPAKLPEGAIVREFSGDKLPRGIVPPSGVETVYAIALDGGHGGVDTQCAVCKPSGGGGSIYSMRNMDCVCSLTPP